MMTKNVSFSLYFGKTFFYVFNPTTSLLTVTMILYASRAGITPTAGTRLALHLRFRYSMRL